MYRISYSGFRGDGVMQCRRICALRRKNHLPEVDFSLDRREKVCYNRGEQKKLHLISRTGKDIMS